MYPVGVRWLILSLIINSLVFCAPSQGRDEILVNFAGTLKAITSKELIIEPEDGNDITFLRARRTRFLDKDGKAVSELEFKVGDAVSIEASQKLNTELEAVNVRHVARVDPEEFLPGPPPPEHAKIQVEGHRGARAVLPENTLPAFEYAIRAGADFLEMDLAVTKDDVLVISHDPTLHPPICRGPRAQAVIRELTLAEVREWDCGAIANPAFPKQKPVPGTRIPTLDQVLDLAKTSSVAFNIEIKSDPKHPEYTPAPAQFARMVLDRIRSHGLEKRVVVQSFDFRTIVATHAIAPDIRLAALTDSDTRDFAAIAKDAEAQIVSPHFRLVTREKVEAAHKAGLQVVPWTANTPEQWDKLIAAGVDGIITDDPAELISYLREEGLH